MVTGADTELTGIVTERDILSKVPLELGGARQLTVEQIMTPRERLVIKPASTTLEACVSTMRAGGFRHLPLSGRSGASSSGASKVQAVISSRDIARHVLAALRKTAPSELPTIAELTASRKQSTGGPEDLVVDVTPETSVADTVLAMREHNAGSVLVRQPGGEFVGIVTERDYLARFVVYDEHAPSERPVSHIMTGAAEVKAVTPEDSVKEALSSMVSGGFRHVPIMEDGHLFGVISMRDIMNYCWELHRTPNENNAERVYESVLGRVDTGFELEPPRGSPGSVPTRSRKPEE